MDASRRIPSLCGNRDPGGAGRRAAVRSLLGSPTCARVGTTACGWVCVQRRSSAHVICCAALRRAATHRQRSDAGTQAAPWATLQKRRRAGERRRHRARARRQLQGLRPAPLGHGRQPDRLPSRRRQRAHHRRQRRHARRHQRRERRLRRSSTASSSTAAPAPASASRSRNSSRCATATPAYNGRWGIFTGFADDLTVEDNETHDSMAEHGIYVVQQRRPADHSRQRRRTTTTPTAST